VVLIFRKALRTVVNKSAYIVGLLPFLVGCTIDEYSVILTSYELKSPAGSGSGEPFLSSSGDAVYMSWLERVAADRHELRFSRLTGSSWEEPKVITSSDRFFVNWADFPSLTSGPNGSLWVHWLERGLNGGYDYGIRIAHSEDEGATWSEPWTPHEDVSATEHGFVSTSPVGDNMGFLWLDGRRFEVGPDGLPATQEMALMHRTITSGDIKGAEVLVDARVCECCQTDQALTSNGPIAVYRDRSPDEVRDIYITRFEGDNWTKGEAVYEDGWETNACPVNGPAVAAIEHDVAVVWFTAANGIPLVKVAFSNDAGVSFGRASVIDDQSPAGRVDLLMLEDRSVLVAWLTRTGGGQAEVRVRRVLPSGQMEESLKVSASSSERASGFPRMALTDGGDVVLAWTDATELVRQVRISRIEMQKR